ncbi:hypothetical protein KIW84_043731 [Lathyrus oleraceus]|uniref:Aminotransferase-like plant mobile domain-containing protein n=1 Tax=Pisum sativum TaxID=3888 RepID=A0A9D4XGH8_PEA|nr:hypothetical protein KIW84_043731 [Pisum sativum]
MTNTFQLPYGMLTPTFFDVASITSLRPIGETFDPNESDEDTIKFDGNHARFSRYIEDYHVIDDDNVFNKEHIAFLSLWLSRYVEHKKRTREIASSKADDPTIKGDATEAIPDPIHVGDSSPILPH